METWVPVLSVREHGRGCRLSLSGIAHGDGTTLQRAGDALVARVVELAAVVRGGASFSPSVPPPHPAILELLYRVGERAARQEDVRGLIFGDPRGEP